MAAARYFGPSVFALTLAAGLYIILKPLFAFLERTAALASFPWHPTGIAAAVFAIAVVYVVGAFLLNLITIQVQACPWWFLALALTVLVADLLLAFRVIFILQQHADDGR